MVANAGSAGASNSMKIVGTMDVSDIDNGFRRVGQGFEGVKGKGKSFGADMRRVGQTVGGLANKLSLMAIAGGSAMVGLASKAPAVAPAMAKMGVAIGQITRNLGEGMAPAFEKVSQWLDKIAGWSGEHPDMFAGIVGSLTALSILKFTGASKFLLGLGGLIISPTVLTALGYLALIAAPAVMIAGGLSVGPALARSVGVGDETQIPIPEAAREQIANSSFLELQQMQNTYGNRIGESLGPESTIQINPETGMIYDYNAMVNDIIANADFQFTDRRQWFLQMNDSTWG